MRLEGQRVAVYARYSTDKQNPRSVDDQVRACREYVEKLGGTVAFAFSDAAVSGSIASRPGLDSLQKAVRDGKVEVVVVEDLSRIGRDVGNNDRVIKDMRSWGARLIALDGFDTEQRGSRLMGAIKSAMAEEYLGELAERTKRGMRGLFEGGFHTGGRVYGYKSVDAGDGTGRKRLAVDEREAAIVRRIFTMHVSGIGQRAIAEALNADRVPSARGGKWSHIVVRAVIRNERYVGVVAFGQRDWKRNEQGRRRWKRRDVSEVRRSVHEELRIIDSDMWNAAQERRDTVMRQHSRGARPKRGYALSGILECGLCGSIMVVTGGGNYYACSGRRRGHGCTNSVSLRERAIRCWLSDRITDTIGAPRTLQGLRRGWAESIGDHDRTLKSEIADRKATLGRLEAGIARLYDVIAEGQETRGTRAAIKEREDHAELQRAAIAALESRLGRVPVIPSSAQVTDFLRRLPDVLAKRPEPNRELLGRMLKGRAVCTPPKRRGEHYGIRAELRPNEILAHTAQVIAGTVYASGSCGGRFLTLGQADFSVILEGDCPNDYGTEAVG